MELWPFYGHCRPTQCFGQSSFFFFSACAAENSVFFLKIPSSVPGFSYCYFCLLALSIISPFFFLLPLINIMIVIIIIKIKTTQWMEQGFTIGCDVKLAVTFTFCERYLTEALGLWLMRQWGKTGEKCLVPQGPEQCFFQWGPCYYRGGTVLPKEGLSQALQGAWHPWPPGIQCWLHPQLCQPQTAGNIHSQMSCTGPVQPCVQR